MVELGRYDRNLAHILVGKLESEGIPAITFDGIEHRVGHAPGMA